MEFAFSAVGRGEGDSSDGIPRAAIDAYRTDLDAMFARIADDLRGRIEPHRLGVEQGRAENVGMVALHPGRGIGDLGEARRMAFGKAVAAEALDLLERCARRNRG